MQKKTATYVEIADVFAHLALTDEQEDVVMDTVSHHVTWGDAFATLITSDSLIYMICEALDHDLMDRGRDGRTVQVFQEGLESKYWQVVRADDLINLEGA